MYKIEIINRGQQYICFCDNCLIESPFQLGMTRSLGLEGKSLRWAVPFNQCGGLGVPRTARVLWPNVG